MTTKALAPMEALLAAELPEGSGWQYEPKWDGFRCLIFRDGSDIYLQSKAGQPLARYFPELVEAASRLKPDKFVLDGEIAIPINDRLSFDDLLMRIHPVASRIQRLSKETPAIFIAFDLLVGVDGKPLVSKSLAQRRPLLAQFAKKFFPGTASSAFPPPPPISRPRKNGSVP